MILTSYISSTERESKCARGRVSKCTQLQAEEPSFSRCSIWIQKIFSWTSLNDNWEVYPTSVNDNLFWWQQCFLDWEVSLFHIQSRMFQSRKAEILYLIFTSCNSVDALSLRHILFLIREEFKNWAELSKVYCTEFISRNFCKRALVHSYLLTSHTLQAEQDKRPA